MHHPVFLSLLGLALLLGCADQPSSSSADEAASSALADTAPGAVAPRDTQAHAPTILILGNSLAAGYGLASVEDAFPSLIQQRIDSLGLPHRVVNAGVSGETTTGGKNRLDWLLRQPIDIFVLELGANDGLRGIDPEQSRANLLAMIEQVRATYPDVEIVLCGMQAPPNMGQDFTSRFRQMYFDIAEKADVHLVPFLLEGVAGEPELNQADGIHPTPEGHQMLADNLWDVLRPLLGKVQGS